ncbi:MAG: hypothetical protein PHQ03_07050 [Methylococcales bacterium]|nr:hypothetical protein [Methylococcales bacterium]
MIETNSKSKSQFVGYFGVKNYEKIEGELIQPLVDIFFDVRNIQKQNRKEIQSEGVFADRDFLDKSKDKNKSFFSEYFYDYIVDGIHKNGDNVEIPVTYCITLDETNCSKTCPKTKIRYDEMLLFDTPVFYFIYIDVKEVFSCLRQNSN